MLPLAFTKQKNYNAGKGGAIAINIPEWFERAYFLQEKGTDRRLVMEGVKNKYSWVDKRSSYLLSDILAAMLLAQLEHKEEIKAKRAKITVAYDKLFRKYLDGGLVSVFKPQNHHQLNHHAFGVVFDVYKKKVKFMEMLRGKIIHVYIGYLPLHSSPMSLQFGYKAEDLPLTEDLASRIVRLPFYTSMADEGLNYCIREMEAVLQDIYA